MSAPSREALLALAAEWERAAGECLERAGDEPSSSDEIEDDALGIAYGECAAALRALLGGAA